MFGGSELEAALLVILVVAAIEAWRLRHAGPNLVLLEMRVGSDQTTGEFRTPGSAAGVNRSAGEAVPVGGSTGHGSKLAHEIDVWGAVSRKTPTAWYAVVCNWRAVLRFASIANWLWLSTASACVWYWLVPVCEI
jgi:hypothetical protein